MGLPHPFIFKYFSIFSSSTGCRYPFSWAFPRTSVAPKPLTPLYGQHVLPGWPALAGHPSRYPPYLARPLPARFDSLPRARRHAEGGAGGVAAPSLDDPQTLIILAAGVEGFILGSLEFSPILLLDPSVRTKLIEYAHAVLEEALEALTTRRSLPYEHILPAALSSLLMSLMFASNERWEWHKVQSLGDILVEAVKSMGKDADDELADAGSLLGSDDLRDGLTLMHLLIYFNEPRGLADVKHAVQKVIRPVAAAERRRRGQCAPWRSMVVSDLAFCLKKAVEGKNPAPTHAWGVLLGGTPQAMQLLRLLAEADEAAVIMLRRGLREAEEAGGDFRRRRSQLERSAGRTPTTTNTTYMPLCPS